MKGHLTSTIATLVMTLAGCGQSGTSGTSWVAPTQGDHGALADAAADGGDGIGTFGTDGSGVEAGNSSADGSAGVGPGTSDTGGSAADGPITSGTDGSAPPVGTPVGAHATAGKLMLDIGGTTQGTDYAFLKVAGKAKLGGELHLTFASGFAPKSGQKFIVVTAAGGITGAFGTITTGGVAVTPGQDATTFYVTVN